MSDFSPVEGCETGTLEDGRTGTLEDGGTGALEDGVIGGLEDEEELYGKEYLRVEETGPGPGQESHGLWIRVSTLHRISVFVQISVLFQKCTEKCTENLCISKQFYVPLLIKLFVIFIQLQHNHK